MGNALYFEPVSITARLEDLDDHVHLDWVALHRDVQDSLALLDVRIRREFPELQCKGVFFPGRTSPFLSYRTFRVSSDPNVESVLAAIAYRNQQDTWMVTADISGEESGRMYFREEDQAIEPDRVEELQNAIRELAHRLSQRSWEVLRGLKTSIQG